MCLHWGVDSIEDLTINSIPHVEGFLNYEWLVDSSSTAGGLGCSNWNSEEGLPACYEDLVINFTYEHFLTVNWRGLLLLLKLLELRLPELALLIHVLRSYRRNSIISHLIIILMMLPMIWLTSIIWAILSNKVLTVHHLSSELRIIHLLLLLLLVHLIHLFLLREIRKNRNIAFLVT